MKQEPGTNPLVEPREVTEKASQLPAQDAGFIGEVQPQSERDIGMMPRPRGLAGDDTTHAPQAGKENILDPPPRQIVPRQNPPPGEDLSSLDVAIGHTEPPLPATPSDLIGQ